MTTDITETVTVLVSLIDDFSRGTLKQSATLTRILAHAHAVRRFQELGEVAFHGNHVVRLLKTLQKQGVDAEHRDKLEQEFSHAIHVFHDLLTALTDGLPAEELETFTSSFLAVSPDALQRLADLAHDFYWLKEWERAMNAQELPE